MNREEASALFEFQRYWTEYKISMTDGVWSAWHLDSPAHVLTAEDPFELRQMLREDHARRTPQSP